MQEKHDSSPTRASAPVYHDPARLSSLPSLDAEYSFGRPKGYLTPRELARLTIVRSRLGDTRAEREAEA